MPSEDRLQNRRQTEQILTNNKTASSNHTQESLLLNTDSRKKIICDSAGSLMNIQSSFSLLINLGFDRGHMLS